MIHTYTCKLTNMTCVIIIVIRIDKPLMKICITIIQTEGIVICRQYTRNISTLSPFFPIIDAETNRLMSAKVDWFLLFERP